MARAAVIPPRSPPKRATRATSKRTTTNTTTTETKRSSTGASKPAPRPTTKGKAPISATESRKRGVRTASATARNKKVEEESDDGTEDELGVIDTKKKTSTAKPKAKPSSGTGATRGRKPAAAAPTPELESEDDDEDELAGSEAPKKRVAGRPKAKAAEHAKPEPATRSRGRPKGSTATKSSTTTTAAKETAQKKPRVESSLDSSFQPAPKELVIATNSTTMRSNMLRGPAKKKKVTFRDPDSEEDESEPEPPPAGRRRATPKKGGLGARPLRNAPAPAPTRGRKPAAAKKGASKPLSPKKATQVAKSISSYVSSDGEDDELNDAKDPIKLVINSPSKHGSENTGLSSPVRRINFAPTQSQHKVDENGEPHLAPPKAVDFSESLFMSSPARRPPPSPFKFTMRETPRRGGIALRDDVKPLAQPNFSPSQNSPLKSSPRKAHLETPQRGFNNFFDKGNPLSQPNFSPGQNSPLKSSPKKGLFGVSFSAQPPLQESSTPLKRSLLQSPAKKINSPFKSSFRRSPLIEQPHSDHDLDLDEENHTPVRNASESPLMLRKAEDDMSVRADSEQAEASVPEHEEGSDQFEYEESHTPVRYSESPLMFRKLEDDISAEAENEQARNPTPDQHQYQNPPEQEEESHTPVSRVSESPLMFRRLEEDTLAGTDSDQVTFSVPEEGRYETSAEHDEQSYTPTSRTSESPLMFRRLEEEMEVEYDEHSDNDTIEADDAVEQEPEVSEELHDVVLDDAQEHDQEQTEDDFEPNSAIPVEKDEVSQEAPVEKDDDETIDEEFDAQNDNETQEDKALSADTFDDAEQHNEEDIPTLPEVSAAHTEDDSGNAEDEAPVDSAVDDQRIGDRTENQEEIANDDLAVEEAEDFEAHDYEDMDEEQKDPEDMEQEVRPTRENEQSSRRQSMVEGLEDVFTEGALASNHNHEIQEVESSPAASEAEEDDNDLAQDAYQQTADHDDFEEDYGDDYAFDDDEATLVAFDTTGQNVLSAPPQDVDEEEESTIPSPQVENPPAQVPTPHIPAPNNATEYRDITRDEMESNDADMSDAEPEADVHGHAQESPRKPSMTENRRQSSEAPRGNRPRFTLLANQLSQWKASSPQKPEPRRSRRRGVFSLAGGSKRPSDAIPLSGEVSYPDLSTTPKSASPKPPALQESSLEVGPIATYEDEAQELETFQADAEQIQPPPEQPSFEIFSDHHSEMAEPVEEGSPSRMVESPAQPAPSVQDTSFDDDKENENVPLPAPVTPTKNRIEPRQTVHTVSKVPLKPEGQISPLKVCRKRGLSLSSTSPTRSSSRIRKSFSLTDQNGSPQPPPRKSQRIGLGEIPNLQPGNSRVREDVHQQEKRPKAPFRPSSPTRSPTRSPRKSTGGGNLVLQGAVVYVNVHTTEGEDASGIFVELLQQMGARCIRNWGWNPRLSVSPDEVAESKEARIGITHVVFKDGGVRTLEKVRQARGLVKCVGVGWVLDCERENKWLDEAHYAVDSSIIPRGGAKRRKSMEPRALSNVNGTLVKTDMSSSSAGNRRSGAAMEDFKRHTPTPPLEEPSTPTSTRQYDADPDERYFQTPKTPGYGFNLDAIGMSPATPFYLNKSKLVQQTCPPKQSNQGLFSSAADRTGGPSDRLRAKLEAARRKSLAFKPKIGSPLIE